jgi:hypothetical protein
LEGKEVCIKINKNLHNFLFGENSLDELVYQLKRVMEAHKSCSLTREVKKSRHTKSAAMYEASSYYIMEDIFNFIELELAAYVQKKMPEKTESTTNSFLFMF